MMNPTIAVPADPWTTVTDDDDYVSHLISLWFTWTYQWSQWLDKDTFIDAMRARDPTSLICTPYMVNMILANACVRPPTRNLFIRNVADYCSFWTQSVLGQIIQARGSGINSTMKQSEAWMPRKGKCHTPLSRPWDFNGHCKLGHEEHHRREFWLTHWLHTVSTQQAKTSWAIPSSTSRCILPTTSRNGVAVYKTIPA